MSDLLRQKRERELHNREKKKHYFAWTHGGIIHCEVPLECLLSKILNENLKSRIEGTLNILPPSNCLSLGSEFLFQGKEDASL